MFGCLAILLTGGLTGLSEPAATPASPAEQPLSEEVRLKGWIVFSARSPRGDWDLLLCRPDGSETRHLTETPNDNEAAPQFSRDGQRLLYRRLPRTESIHPNLYGTQGELMIANSDGTQPRVIGRSGEFPWASWSPDGQQIACLSIKGISFVDLKTRQVTRTLERKGFFQQMTWSPDGQWLSGVANSYGTGWSVARIYVPTGSANAVNRVDCCTPDWFPDSRKIVFSWRPPGQKGNDGYGWTQLWMADAEGQSRRLIYGEDGRHVYGGHVSPDGRYVLFTGNMREDGDPGNAGAPMNLMRLEDAPIIGGESRDLRARHGPVKDGPILRLAIGWEPSWTFSETPAGPAPGKIASSGTPAPADDNAGAGTAGLGRTAEDLARELHSQGWLAFSATTEAGDWDLFLMRPDGSDRRHMTDTREFNEAGARFSPDGKKLLFYRMPKSVPVDNNTYGTFELVLANADGGQASVIGAGFSWASWSPDSVRLACLAPKGIQIFDLATRQVLRELPRKGIVQQLGWSPDGRWFVGTANGLGPFWNIGLLNAETGGIVAVSATERYNCTPDWWPDSQRIIYSRGIIPQKGGRAELWVAAVDGRGRHLVYAEESRHIYGGCASPNGRYVLFTRSVEDLGKVDNSQTTMAIIRWSDTPMGMGRDDSQPTSIPDRPAGPRLDLGPGWEPHWTPGEVLPTPVQPGDAVKDQVPEKVVP